MYQNEKYYEYSLIFLKSISGLKPSPRAHAIYLRSTNYQSVVLVVIAVKYEFL